MESSGMPLLSLTRFVTMLLSVVVVGLAIYMAWNWYQGDLVRLDNGDLVQRREDWVIWLAAGLGLFSILGRLLIAPILARPDRGHAIAQQAALATEEVVEGVNHIGMLERADHYNARIGAFADRVFVRG